MTRKLILVIALLALVSMMIMPASATYNWSFASDAGNLSAGSAFPIATPTAFCSALGFSDMYPGFDQYVWITEGVGTESIPPSFVGDLYAKDGSPWTYTILGATNGSWIFQHAACGPSGQNFIGPMYHVGASITPTASFSCVPTSQYLNTDVVCTDTSSNNPTSWLWVILDSDGDVRQTHTGQDFSWQSVYAGVFTVNLRATNSGGSDWENKTNYVTITPTVTPTPTTTIPGGYIQTRIHLWDQTGNMIHGGNIDVLDVEADVWTNSTHDADGILYVNTLPYHTIDIYGSFDIFENEFLPNELLGQETGYEGGYVYFLTLFPYESLAPPGQTSLYVEVRDADTHYFITYAVVRIDYSGQTYVQNTANAPSALFLVPNNTIIHATASKTGYISGTVVTNSSPASSKTITIELSKSTVTPTVTGTVIPGEITVRPTYAPGCDPSAYDAATCTQNKDADMMNQIRDAGPGLIALAIIAAIIGLIKLMTKR